MSSDAWIGRLVPGRSFIDVGGLWGTHNEKVSVAARAGASSTTMVDFEPAGNALWQAFEARAAALGVSGHASIEANLDDPALPERIGQFDVVHCSGVVYHCPDIYHSIRQLARLARRHVLIGSMTMPERVENAEGALDFSGGQMITVPALRGQARAVVTRHFQDLGFVVHNITSPESFPWSRAGRPSYSPWWWLYSAATLADMVEATGLRVIETIDVWAGNAHYLVCETAG
jgi:hypothetical protein